MAAIGRLQHPNIVQAYDAREINGTQILAMEYVEGLSLTELIKRAGGRISVADACEIARQAALALQCAHVHGLVHRDIKPSNLMLARDGLVKLLDLGLALLHAGPAGGTQELDRPDITSNGQVMGTVDYMAPEQCCDSHSVDIRADIYSLGCTLYALLCGKGPFSGPMYSDPAKKIAGHLRDAVPPIRECRDDVPDLLIDVLDRMMAKDPDARYSTPAEVANALATLTTGSDLPALIERAESGDAAGNQAAQEVTPTDELCSSALVGTQSSLPEISTAKTPHSSRRWKPRSIAVGLAFFAGAIAVLLAVIIIVNRSNDDQTIVTVPDNSEVEIQPNGSVTVRTPAEQTPAEQTRTADEPDENETTTTSGTPDEKCRPPVVEPDKVQLFEYQDLYASLKQTVDDSRSDFIQRLLYTEISATMNRHQVGSWRIGPGMSKDGSARVFTVRNMQWFIQKLTPLEAEQMGLRGQSWGKNLDVMWTPLINEIMKIENAGVRVETDTDGNKTLVGRLRCTVDTPRRVDYLVLVFTYPLLEEGENVTGNLYQYVRPERLPGDWFEVRIPLSPGQSVPRMGRFHFESFLFEPKASFYRISNQLTWSG